MSENEHIKNESLSEGEEQAKNETVNSSAINEDILTQDQADSEDAEKVSKDKKTGVSKTMDALKGTFSELFTLLKRLVPFKKSSKAGKEQPSDRPVLGGKPPSKIPFILGKTRLGVSKSASAVGKKGKTAYKKTYEYLDKKGLIEKIQKNKKTSYSILIGVPVLLILLITLIASSGHKNSHHGPSAVSNLMRINNMQNALGKIQSNLTMTSQMSQEERQNVENKLQEIDAKLGQISSGAGAKQGAQIKALRATLQSKSVNLSQKISALNSEIKQIKTKVFPAPTLSAKALPFKVMAIEPWNGKPFVEIQQRQNSTMIDYVGLYGVRGGWKVIDLNAPEQTATFLNQNGQVVHVAVRFKENSGD